ncbi:response regulator [Denitromonas halophila]|uniref:Response regulator n=1 Tax=Denitromonas halophila TaxID=1629404 RepID=A0A557QJP2_9RHOO|nr:response regulator [Denitromonas halophila]TVO53121.1 response regulator [Denitromonas halophila]
MNHRKLLLVEDDAQDLRLTLRALKRINVVNEVDVVGDGAAALDYLFCRNTYAQRSPADAPAVVLLDIRLPKLSGLEVLEQLRQDTRTDKIPVVMLTSSDEEQDILRSYDLGANSYVRKPLDPGEFTEAVAQLGLYWMLLNEPPKSAE